MTLSGAVDVGVRAVQADKQHRRLSESTDGLNGSELSFHGAEDLGGGLAASFTLQAGVNANNGTANRQFFGRRSTLSLTGPFGELRLGRDYAPSFWNLADFDPFGTSGIASGSNVRQLYAVTRMDNAVGYFLPSTTTGIEGQFMMAASEGGTTTDRPARYVGGRLLYKTAALNLAVAASELRYVAPSAVGSDSLTGSNIATVARPGDRQTTWNVGGSYDFGVVKLMGVLNADRLAGYRETSAGLGAVISTGAFEWHLGYDRSRLEVPVGARRTVDQVKAGLVYNLSRRTALYTAVARLDNKDGTTLTLPSAAAQVVPGGKSAGAELGLRHFF